MEKWLLMSGWITPITSAAGVRPTKTHGQKSTMYGIILTEAERNIQTAVAALQIKAGKVSHSEYFAADVRKRTCE